MPISVVWNLCAILQSIATFCRSKRNTCYGFTLVYITDFRFLTYIAN